jgi:hypothetical protein
MKWQHYLPIRYSQVVEFRAVPAVLKLASMKVAEKQQKHELFSKTPTYQQCILFLKFRNCLSRILGVVQQILNRTRGRQTNSI